MQPFVRPCLVLAALLAAASPAVAESVAVTGDAADLTVEAKAASLDDVIVAVGEAVGSKIVPPESLPSATITGVYQGSVSEVLKALVPSANFVVVWRDGRVAVNFVDGDDWTPVAEAKPANGEDGDGQPAEVPGEVSPGSDEPPSPARRIY